jgi:hypothetical protein
LFGGVGNGLKRGAGGRFRVVAGRNRLIQHLGSQNFKVSRPILNFLPSRFDRSIVETVKRAKVKNFERAADGPGNLHSVIIASFQQPQDASRPRRIMSVSKV